MRKDHEMVFGEHRMNEIDHEPDGRKRMTQRREEILDMISRNGYVTTDELCRRFYISEPTVRRELASLEAEGLIRRSRGGAASLSGGMRLPIAFRQSSHKEEKRRIGKAAAELVSDGDIIFIDTSTTAMAILEYLRQRRGVTVVTNSLPVMETIALMNVGCDRISCKCTGGDFNPESMGLVGSAAERFVMSMRYDLFFFSTPCISHSGRISDYSERETHLRIAVIENSAKTVYMFDSSKFGLDAAYTVSNSGRMAYVLSDAAIPDEICRKCKFILA